jgi:hypothetical protein
LVLSGPSSIWVGVCCVGEGRWLFERDQFGIDLAWVCISPELPGWQLLQDLFFDSMPLAYDMCSVLLQYVVVVVHTVWHTARVWCQQLPQLYLTAVGSFCCRMCVLSLVGA